MKMPIRMPGIIPDIKREPMEVPVTDPYTTKVMDGGMTIPIAPAVLIRAALVDFS